MPSHDCDYVQSRRSACFPLDPSRIELTPKKDPFNPSPGWSHPWSSHPPLCNNNVGPLFRNPHKIQANKCRAADIGEAGGVGNQLYVYV